MGKSHKMHIPEIVFSSAATQAFNIFQNASLKLKESKKREKKKPQKQTAEWTLNGQFEKFWARKLQPWTM